MIHVENVTKLYMMGDIEVNALQGVSFTIADGGTTSTVNPTTTSSTLSIPAAAGVEVVNCGQPDVKLFRAVAPIDAVITYVQGGMVDKRDYRLAWKRS